MTITCAKCNKDSTYGIFTPDYFCPYCGTPLYPVEYSGRAGISASFKLDSNGYLTVSGTGSIYDVPPWHRYRGLIRKANVECGITHIGGFDGCVNLQTVSLPKTLVAIKDSTFKECASLTEVYIESKLLLIGESAFAKTPLVEVHYRGTSEEFVRGVFIEKGNKPLLHAEAYFEASSEVPKVWINATQFAAVHSKINAARTMSRLLMNLEEKEESWICSKIKEQIRIKEAAFCTNCGCPRRIN